MAILAGGITVCSYVSSLEPGFPIPACFSAAGSQENHSQISPPGTETTPTALLLEVKDPAVLHIAAHTDHIPSIAAGTGGPVLQEVAGMA